MNTLERRAIFKTFIPVPPKASFPIITAKATEIAKIHKGKAGGMTNGIKAPDTRKPSSIP